MLGSADLVAMSERVYVESKLARKKMNKKGAHLKTDTMSTWTYKHTPIPVSILITQTISHTMCLQSQQITIYLSLPYPNSFLHE